MDVEAFDSLQNQDKIEVLYQAGVYVGKRTENGEIIMLFQLEGFYVEVVFQKYRSLVKSIQCSNSTDILKPYLTQVGADIVEKITGKD